MDNMNTVFHYLKRKGGVEFYMRYDLEDAVFRFITDGKGDYTGWYRIFEDNRKEQKLEVNVNTMAQDCLLSGDFITKEQYYSNLD